MEVHLAAGILFRLLLADAGGAPHGVSRGSMGEHGQECLLANMLPVQDEAIGEIALSPRLCPLAQQSLVVGIDHCAISDSVPVVRAFTTT